MKNFLRYLLPLLLSSISLSAIAEDLLTIYQQALTSNPQLAAAAANLDAVRERRPQAIAGLLPFLSADGRLERQRLKDLNQSNPATRSTNQFGSIDLTQPIFRYDRWIQIKQADHEIAQAEADYMAARQELMIQVAERYFTVLDGQDNLEFALAEKSSIGRQLEQATQRFEVGLIAITDVKAAQARYDLSVSREIQALSTLAGAKDSLAETAGAFYEYVVPLKADLELVRPQPDSAEQWIATAKRQNLKVLSAQAGSESALQEIRRQRAGHLPTLDATASARYTDTNFGGIAPIKRHDRDIGLQLNIPLYQGGLVNSKTREARNRFSQSTDLLQQEVRAAELQTRNAFRGVVTDIAQVNALSESLKSTQVAVEAEEAGFEVGTRTIVDVLNSQREYYLAKLTYARARYLYVVDQLRLKRAAGILSEEDIAEVNLSLAEPLPIAQP